MYYLVFNANIGRHKICQDSKLINKDRHAFNLAAYGPGNDELKPRGGGASFDKQS